MTIHKSFGELLHRERKKQGLTALAVAEACGKSRSYITLIENGKRLPGKKIITKIADALNLKTVVVLNWYLDDLNYQIRKSFKVS
jgi:transcriptional regulator with XRE-family HTH domain